MPKFSVCRSAHRAENLKTNQTFDCKPQPVSAYSDKSAIEATLLGLCNHAQTAYKRLSVLRFPKPEELAKLETAPYDWMEFDEIPLEQVDVYSQFLKGGRPQIRYDIPQEYRNMAQLSRNERLFLELNWRRVNPQKVRQQCVPAKCPLANICGPLIFPEKSYLPGVLFNTTNILLSR